MEPQLISYAFIDRRSDLDRVAAELKKEMAIGVDLEADSMFHYHEKVCLIQISTPSKNILIDPLALEDLSVLEQIFSDPAIRKIFHGADYDIRSLHRDFGIEVNSLFDTQIAAAFLGIRETGLANLLKDFYSITVEKKYQKRDWSRRPLTQPMLDYAAKDAFYLLPLANMLEEKLRSEGRFSFVEEECERLSKVRINQSDRSHLFLKFKGAGKLDSRSLTVLETILRFRDERARKLDRPPFKVFGNAQIKKMVKEKPRNLKDLKGKECLSQKQIKDLGRVLCKRIDRAMKLPEGELFVYPKKTGRRVGAKAAKRVKALKKWRDQQAGKMGLEPALICSNTQIQSLAILWPKSLKEMEGITEIKNWQRELFGHEICSILNPQ